MNGDVDAAEVIVLEHNLAHTLTILERVQGGFGKEDLAACWVDLELLEESVVPKVLHVVPFLDDTILHLLTKSRFISKIVVFVVAVAVAITQSLDSFCVVAKGSAFIPGN